MNSNYFTSGISTPIVPPNDITNINEAGQSGPGTPDTNSQVSTNATTTSRRHIYSGAPSSDQIIDTTTDEFIEELVKAGTINTISQDLFTGELIERTKQAFDECKVLYGPSRYPKTFQGLTTSQIAKWITARYTVRRIYPENPEEYSKIRPVLGVYVSPELVKLLGWQFMSRLGTYITDRDDIEEVILRSSSQLSERRRKEVLTYLEHSAPSVIRYKGTDLIPVGNGIYDTETDSLMPFSSDLVFLAKTPVNYNPNAKDIRIINPDGTVFTFESWLDSLTDVKQTRLLLRQGIAAVIRPNMPYDQALFLFDTEGTGNNGKGTYESLLRNLCPCHVSLPIKAFGEQFGIEKLIGAMAVITDENDDDTSLNNCAKFKAVITGDVVEVNRKHKPIVDHSHHGLVVECFNHLPLIKDISGSLERRIVFVAFRKCFTGIENKAIKHDYLKRQDILEYVLLQALRLKFDKFVVPDESRDIMAEFKAENDPIREFWNTMREQFVWSLLPFSFLYDLYVSYLRHDFPRCILETKPSFKKQLLRVIKDDPDWYCDDKNKQIAVTANNMGKIEPLISEYNLVDWYRKFYSGGHLCAPKLSASYRGIVRR